MVNLEVYKTKLEEIRQFARENNVSEFEIDKALHNSFCILKTRNQKCSVLSCLKIIILILFMVIVCFVSFNWKFLAIIVMRNLQNSIYPTLKLLRKVAIPIIQHYPSLSGMIRLSFT